LKERRSGLGPSGSIGSPTTVALIAL
jgi:hypothetical protein